MISIAICDDNKLFVNKLASYLKKYQDETEIEIRILIFYNGESLLKSNHTSIDLVFLDIDMPGINGIETAKRLQQMNPLTSIIFLTSLVQFALAGYTVRAFNYLLKNKTKYNRIKSELDDWIKRYRLIEQPFITVYNNNGKYKISLKSLKFIETHKRNLLFHTEDNEIICYRKLKDVEQELKEHGFVRCHVGFLVNLFYVCAIENKIIRLTTGEIIPVSRLRRNNILDSLTSYWGNNA